MKMSKDDENMGGIEDYGKEKISETIFYNERYECKEENKKKKISIEEIENYNVNEINKNNEINHEKEDYETNKLFLRKELVETSKDYLKLKNTMDNESLTISNELSNIKNLHQNQTYDTAHLKNYCYTQQDNQNQELRNAPKNFENGKEMQKIEVEKKIEDLLERQNEKTVYLVEGMKEEMKEEREREDIEKEDKKVKEKENTQTVEQVEKKENTEMAEQAEKRETDLAVIYLKKEIEMKKEEERKEIIKEKENEMEKEERMDKKKAQDKVNDKKDGKKERQEGEHLELEDLFTVETFMNTLNSIHIKNKIHVNEKDINANNCKIMMLDSYNEEMRNKDEITEEKKTKEVHGTLINILLYFQNKNYIYFIIYCLKRKNIVYINYFNPLLCEGEIIETVQFLFVNSFFPHIILGFNSGRIALYNHEGILCMQNKFIDGKIQKIFIEYKKEYLLFLYENNIVVNSNINVIKHVTKENSKYFPFDYIFSINKNILINHIILRNGISNDFFLHDMYSMFSKTDLVSYISNRLNEVPSAHNDNANYIVTAQNVTISIFNVSKTNASNTFLSKKENFSVIGKVASKINSFIKTIFGKKNENNNIISINNDSATTDVLNSHIIHYFNDPQKYILAICICPWNDQLMLAQDNLGRITLYNISTLYVLHVWKSYRASFMSFIQKKTNEQNSENQFQKLYDTTFEKGILFYLKRRNIIEIWDFKTLSKIYRLKVSEDSTFLKRFFYDSNVENDISFFNSGNHIFLMNERFEIFHLKWK